MNGNSAAGRSIASLRHEGEGEVSTSGDSDSMEGMRTEPLPPTLDDREVARMPRRLAKAASHEPNGKGKRTAGDEGDDMRPPPPPSTPLPELARSYSTPPGAPAGWRRSIPEAGEAGPSNWQTRAIPSSPPSPPPPSSPPTGAPSLPPSPPPSVNPTSPDPAVWQAPRSRSPTGSLALPTSSGEWKSPIAPEDVPPLPAHLNDPFGRPTYLNKRNRAYVSNDSLPDPGTPPSPKAQKRKYHKEVLDYAAVQSPEAKRSKKTSTEAEERVAQLRQEIAATEAADAADDEAIDRTLGGLSTPLCTPHGIRIRIIEATPTPSATLAAVEHDTPSPLSASERGLLIPTGASPRDVVPSTTPRRNEGQPFDFSFSHAIGQPLPRGSGVYTGPMSMWRTYDTPPRRRGHLRELVLGEGTRMATGVPEAAGEEDHESDTEVDEPEGEAERNPGLESTWVDEQAEPALNVGQQLDDGAEPAHNAREPPTPETEPTPKPTPEPKPGSASDHGEDMLIETAGDDREVSMDIVTDSEGGGGGDSGEENDTSPVVEATPRMRLTFRGMRTDNAETPARNPSPTPIMLRIARRQTGSPSPAPANGDGVSALGEADQKEMARLSTRNVTRRRRPQTEAAQDMGTPRGDEVVVDEPSPTGEVDVPPTTDDSGETKTTVDTPSSAEAPQDPPVPPPSPTTPAQPPIPQRRSTRTRKPSSRAAAAAEVAAVVRPARTRRVAPTPVSPPTSAAVQTSSAEVEEKEENDAALPPTTSRGRKRKAPSDNAGPEPEAAKRTHSARAPAPAPTTMPTARPRRVHRQEPGQAQAASVARPRTRRKIAAAPDPMPNGRPLTRVRTMRSAAPPPEASPEVQTKPKGRVKAAPGQG